MLTFGQLSPKHLRFSEFCGSDNILLQALVELDYSRLELDFGQC